MVVKITWTLKVSPSDLLTLTTPSQETVRGSRAVSPELVRVWYKVSTLRRQPTHDTSPASVLATSPLVTIRHATTSSLLRLNTAYYISPPADTPRQTTPYPTSCSF